MDRTANRELSEGEVTCTGCRERIKGRAIAIIADADAPTPEAYHPACIPLQPGWTFSPPARAAPADGLDGHRESGEPDVLNRRRY